MIGNRYISNHMSYASHATTKSIYYPNNNNSLHLLNRAMNRQSLKSYCTGTGVTAINPLVRTNANGYPFITILRGDVAENLYFSKKASAEVDLGMDIKAQLPELYVVETINAAGESRTKLSFRGESSYVDVADLF